MHEVAMEHWGYLICKHLIRGMRVLDVGSYDLNGTLRPLIEGAGGNYTGLDIAPGPNVDVVATHPYQYPFPDDSFDYVISNATIEHVRRPWEWMQELARIVRIGGTIIIMGPVKLGLHASEVAHHPVDCWRVYPDGMAELFCGARLIMDCVDLTADGLYCWGVARKG